MIFINKSHIIHKKIIILKFHKICSIMNKKVLKLALLSIALSSCKPQMKLSEKEIIYELKDSKPSARQIDWQKLEYYGFIHFNMNTFTDREWGYGDENPANFNPTELDVEQWVRVAKNAGMKGLILTAKHHDGFCLWPSAYTEHSIKNSPYKGGKGDIVKELAEACKKHGLLLGLYLSPWDRNHAEYGREEYVKVFLGQLDELMTNYGDLFEVWFDGANGGDGYYGGSREHRKIDANTYYQWDKVIAKVRKHHPNAVIFGANGADIRWIGNEDGTGSKTNWSTMDVSDTDHVARERLQNGLQGGGIWKPAEADVSVRPGWYYHAREDHLVKSLSHLVDIYYKSVGRNANLLLNIPVDNRGLVHPNDEKRLYQLREIIEADFKDKVSEGAIYKTNNKEINSRYMTDEKLDTYFAFDSSEENPFIEIDLKEPKIFNRLQLQEDISFGQNVASFKFEILKDNKWETIKKGTTIGYQRLLRFDPVKAQKARIVIDKALNTPIISTFNLYKAPNLLVEPVINRNKKGEISFKVPNEQIEIYYSFSKMNPEKFQRYNEPIHITQPKDIYFVSYDPETKKYSDVIHKKIDISKEKFIVVGQDGTEVKEAVKAIDEDEKTVYSTSEGDTPEFILDLGENHQIRGISYLPSQERWAFGTIKKYEIAVSNDLKTWKTVKQGEFSNIKNNPIEQKEYFDEVKTRYIKLKSNETTDGYQRISFAEIGVITAKD